jgi:Secretion system C-terminal sorting domain/SprB repeat
MGNFSIKNIVGALICALFILPTPKVFSQAVEMVPDSLYLCNGGGYSTIDTIRIMETVNTDFSEEPLVTYRFDPPAGFEFQAGTGAVTAEQPASFTFIFLNIQPGFVELLYTCAPGANAILDTIYFTGLQVRAIAAGSFGDISRVASSGTEASHASNGLGVNSHGVLISPAAITISPSTVTDISCNGASDGTIVVNAVGGLGNLTFSNDGGSTFQAGNTFTPLAPGPYDIQVQDSFCTEVGPTENLTDPSAVSISNEVIVDVSCNGAADGSITVTASGGTGVLAYSIDNFTTNQASGSFTGLSGLTYNIEVRDANGCPVIGSNGTLNEPTALILNAPGTTDPGCNAASDGQIVVNASGGTGPYEYSIDNGTNYSTSATFTGLAAGTYNLAARDANLCVVTGTNATLTDPPALNITLVTPTNVVCNGANDGTITITASGGTGTLNYSITGGAPFGAGNSFTSLSSGSYVPAVEDANGCVALATSVNIIDPSAVLISNEVVVDVSCNGAADGSITITASGGTGVLAYSIDNFTTNQASGSFTGLSGLNYDIEVQDANSCSAIGSSGTLNAPTVLVLNAPGTTDPSCVGASDGQVVVNVSGGTGPYEYSIDNGTNYSTGATFTGLAAGTYNLAARDANLCVVTGTNATLTDPPALNITLVTPTNVVCNGDNNGTITITAGGGTGTLNYSIDGGSSYQVSNSFTGLGPGTYSPAVRDANLCEVFANPEVITEPQGFLGTLLPTITNVSCNGAGDGSIDVTASVTGGTPPYLYSIDSGTTFLNQTFFPGLGPTVFAGVPFIFVRDANNCVGPILSAGGVTEPTVLVPGGANVTNVTTAGGSDGQIDVVGTSGATTPYFYSLDGGTNTQTSTNFSGLIAGTYTVTVIDANGCTGSISPINISEPGSGLQAGSIDINGGSSFDVCIGLSTPLGILNSVADATGGNTDSTLNYQWQFSPNGAAWTDIGGATSNTYIVPTPYAATTFYRRETNRGANPGSPFEGPVFTNFVLLNVNAIPVPTITIADPDNLACVEGAPVTITGFPLPGGGATGVFKSTPTTSALVDNTNGSATFTPSAASPMAYSIRYVYNDAIGCGSIDSDVLTIAENTSATLSIAKNSFLITDPTEPLIGGPAGGNYSGPGISGNSFTPLIAGVGGPYDLHYVQSDANGCIDSATQVVNVLDTGGSQIQNLDPEYCEYNNSVVIAATMPSGAVSRFPRWRITGNNGLSIINDTAATFDPTLVTMSNTSLTVSFLFSKSGNPDSTTQEVIVFTKPVVSISGPSGPFCDVVDALVYTGIPTNSDGAWYSTNIVDNGDGTAVFDPNAPIAGPGNHDLNYLYIDNHSTISCTDSATIMVVVNPLPSPAFTNLDSNYCTNAGDTILTATPIPGGFTSGVFIGSGLADNTDGTANFVPSSLPSGNFILSYEFTDANNCINRIDSTIAIVQQPFLAYDIPSLDYCNNDERDTLVNVSPSGGTFVGMGMSGSDSTFFPTDLGNVLGSNAITYFYTDPVSGCSDSLRKTLTLHQKPFVNFLDLLVDYCADKGQTISVLTDAPVSGVHSWTLSPDPSAIIVANNQVTLDIDQMTGGTNYNLDYVYTLPTGNSCQDSVSGGFLLKALPMVTFSVTDELGSILTGDPIRFCQNEDSIVFIGNQNGGLFINNGTQSDLVNLPSSDSAYYSPVSTFDRPGSNLNREINYTFTDPGTGCFNDTTLRTIVNELPTPGGMNGFQSAITNGIAFFCTEDDSTLITGIPPSSFFVRANSYLKMNKPNNGLIGGIFPTGLDSALFRPKLISDDYVVRYIFTDTAGCTDSVEQDITINAVPDISAAIETSSNTVMDTIPVPYCINDPNLLIQLFVNDASNFPPLASDSAVIFIDLTEPGTIVRGSGGEWYFRPLNADSLGIHNISYEYISGGGCRDAEIFQILILDTPSTSIGNLVPEYCKTDNSRLILLSGNSTIPGAGIFTKSSQINLIDNLNNTANFFPDGSAWATGQTITFSFIESASGESCKDTVIYNVDIFPMPNPGFFMTPASICQDDNPAQIQPIIAIGTPSTWTDSSFVYTGIGVDTAGVPVGNAEVFPNLYTIPLPYTDAGIIDTITFIRTSTKGCTDSLKKAINVHARPRIFLEIRAKSDTLPLTDFCHNDGTFFDLYFGNIDNISPSIAPQFDGIGQVGSEFKPSIPSNPGIKPISLVFTTIAGCTSFDTVYANVFETPVSSFDVGNFCLADSIVFTDFSSADDTTEQIPGSAIKLPDTVIAWEWVFDAPSTTVDDTRQNPRYLYPLPGDFTTELTITTAIGCQAVSDTTFHIGPVPEAKFSWDEICVTKQVQFTDETIHDNDRIGWNWTLAPGNVSLDSAPTMIYSSAGPYLIRLIVETRSGCFDTIEKTLDIRPIIGIGGGNPDYASDFDNDIIEWRPGALPNSPVTFSWEQASPSGNIINSAPDASTTNVWITDADSVHNVGEKSFVMGPCFDFSSAKRPMIRFQHWNESVTGRTGAVLQYSLNKGQVWITMGDLETGWEWYDSDPIIGNPGNQPFNRIGWSGSTQSKGGWQDSRHQLDELRQQDDVLLRIGFGADSVSAEREGFAFGNVVIGERTKKVIIEHFTNSSDINSQQGDIQHNNLIDNNIYDVYDVQFHTDFPADDPANLDNPTDNSSRSFIYSVSSVPRTLFEGNQYSGPTFDFTNNFKMVNGDNDLIERRILGDALYDVDISSNKTQTGISGAVTITAREDISTRKLRIQTAIIEAFVNSSSYSSPTPLPNSVFRSVMKKMLPDAIGSFVEKSWVAGEQQVFNFNYTYSNVYDPDTVSVVAYVQNGTTKEIYQASSDDSSKIFDPTGGLNTWTLNQNFDFILFPNPTSDQVYIRFEEILDKEVQIDIIDQLGKNIMSESLRANEYEIELDLRGLPAGIFYVVVGNEQEKSIKRLVKK